MDGRDTLHSSMTTDMDYKSDRVNTKRKRFERSDKPILHIQSKIHSNLNTRTLSFVPAQSTVCICTHAHLAPFCALFVCTFSIFKYNILYIPTMVSQEDG